MLSGSVDAPVCEPLRGKKAEFAVGRDINPRGVPVPADGGRMHLLGLSGSLPLCQDHTDTSEGPPMPPAVLNGPVTVSLHQSLIQPGTAPTSRCKALAKNNGIACELDPGSRSFVLCKVR